MRISSSPSGFGDCTSSMYERFLSGSRLFVVAILRGFVALLGFSSANDMMVWHLKDRPCRTLCSFTSVKWRSRERLIDVPSSAYTLSQSSGDLDTLIRSSLVASFTSGCSSRDFRVSSPARQTLMCQHLGYQCISYLEPVKAGRLCCYHDKDAATMCSNPQTVANYHYVQPRIVWEKLRDDAS